MANLRNRIWIAPALLISLGTLPAKADISFTNVNAFTDAFVLSIVRPIAMEGEFKPYRPATPLGLGLGLDLGADVTLITLPADFLAALAAVGGSLTSPLPVVRLQLHKGLPFGVDLGFSYFGYGASLRFWGLMGQWAFLTMPLDVAFRVVYTNMLVAIVNAYSTSFEFVVSKGLGPINPYGLVGYQLAGGSLNLGGLSFPGTVTTPNPSFGGLKTALGLELKLFILKIAGEWSTNTQGQNSLGGKVSLSF